MASLAGDDVTVLAVGFDRADDLAALAGHLGWAAPFLADPDRSLYRRLGLRRAPWWRVWSPATLWFYARSFAARADRTPGPSSNAPLDVHQMGGDAVVVGGVAVRRWLPRTPADRVAPRVVVAAARAYTESM